MKLNPYYFAALIIVAISLGVFYLSKETVTFTNVIQGTLILAAFVIFIPRKIEEKKKKEPRI